MLFFPPFKSALTVTLTIDAEGSFLPSLFRLFEIPNKAAADSQKGRETDTLHLNFKQPTLSLIQNEKCSSLLFIFPSFEKKGKKTFLCGTADGFSLSLPLLLSAALEKKLFYSATMILLGDRNGSGEAQGGMDLHFTPPALLSLSHPILYFPGRQ